MNTQTPRPPMYLLSRALIVTLLLALGLGTPASAEDAPPSLSVILEHYEGIRLALTGDSTEGVAEHARAIHEGFEKMVADWSPERAGIEAEQAEAARALLPDLSKASAVLAEAESLEAARDAFYELSKPLVRLRKTAAGPMPVVAYCAMSKRSWLQPKGDIGNPYHGSSMPRCGEIVDG